MNQALLTEWVGGFFDGEGNVNVSVAPWERMNVGYHSQIAARIGHGYVAGLVDGEGTIGVGIAQSEDQRIGYSPKPAARVKMVENDPLVSRLMEYADQIGFEPNIVRHKEPQEDHHNPSFVWGVSGIDDVEIFLSSIRDTVVVKRREIEVILNEIIPLMRRGEHLNRRGFLRLMAWRDVANSHKGGNRGKYSLEYFESLWGMSLEDDRLPGAHPRAKKAHVGVE